MSEFFYKYCSIGKNENNVVNEDAAVAMQNLIAVSDGAGGGGVFADKWSATLIENLPDKPISSFDDINCWLDNFVDDFYNRCEVVAKKKSGLFLDKFYNEGSFATLAAVWKVSDSLAQWLVYGDSTVFCFNTKTQTLTCSASSLLDFDKPPYLLNTISEINPNGLRWGNFSIDSNCILFVASDALSHFLFLTYLNEYRESKIFKNLLNQSLEAHSKTSNFSHAVLADSEKFLFSNIFKSLCRAINSENDFKDLLYSFEQHGVLAHDDYSLAVMACGGDANSFFE